MADEVKPPPSPLFPWLAGGAVLLAAWWWEKKYGGRSVGSVALDKLVGGDDDDEEEDDSDDDEGASVAWTDKPIRKPKRLAALSDVGGPITDAYIAPIKLATTGNCDEAVAALERAAGQGDQIAGRKKLVVRRALRRSAMIVTENCPKEVSDAIGEREELRAEAEGATDSLKRRSAAPEFRRDWSKEYERVIEPVRRTRGEAGRFKRKTAGKSLEYRRKGPGAWRVLDLHTGAESIKKAPTGRARGRPRLK